MTIQAGSAGKTILGKTIKAFSPLKVHSLQKRSRKEKPSKGQAYHCLVCERLCGFFPSSRAVLIFFACGSRWDICFALDGFALNHGDRKRTKTHD